MYLVRNNFRVMVDACERSNLVSLLLINMVVKASLFICKIVKGPKNTKIKIEMSLTVRKIIQA